MIKGLYEVHLPVRDLQRSIAFYENIGLELAYEYDDVAFLWIVPNKSWIGLWQTEISKDRESASFPGHGRHIAFQVDFEDIKKASLWLAEKGITLRSHGGLEPLEPIVRPHLVMSFAILMGERMRSTVKAWSVTGLLLFSKHSVHGK